MVASCCVVGCTNRRLPENKDRLRFFRFPMKKRKRQAWIQALNRKNWSPNRHSRVCSAHFVSGRHCDDKNEIDFAPSIFKELTDKQKRRLEREYRRNLAKTFEEALVLLKDVEANRLKQSLQAHSNYIKKEDGSVARETLLHHDIGEIYRSYQGDFLIHRTDSQCFAFPVSLEQTPPALPNHATLERSGSLVQNDEIHSFIDVLRNNGNTVFYRVEQIKVNSSSAKVEKQPDIEEVVIYTDNVIEMTNDLKACDAELKVCEHSNLHSAVDETVDVSMNCVRNPKLDEQEGSFQDLTSSSSSDVEESLFENSKETGIWHNQLHLQGECLLSKQQQNADQSRKWIVIDSQIKIENESMKCHTEDNLQLQNSIHNTQPLYNTVKKPC